GLRHVLGLGAAPTAAKPPRPACGTHRTDQNRRGPAGTDSTLTSGWVTWPDDEPQVRRLSVAGHHPVGPAIGELRALTEVEGRVHVELPGHALLPGREGPQQ